MIRRTVALSFTLVLLSAACSTTSSSSPGGGGSASGSPTGTPIVIGFPADLTTDWAYYDKPMEQGAQFAVDKINDAGGLLGRPLQLKTVDRKSVV